MESISTNGIGIMKFSTPLALSKKDAKSKIILTQKLVIKMEDTLKETEQQLWIVSTD